MLQTKDSRSKFFAKIVALQIGALVVPVIVPFVIILIDRDSRHAMIELDVSDVTGPLYFFYFLIPFVEGVAGTIFFLVNFKNLRKSPGLQKVSLLSGIAGLISPIWLYILLIIIVFQSYQIKIGL